MCFVTFLNWYFNPYPARLTYLNFQALEVVPRYRDPQPQVLENYLNLVHNISDLIDW